MIKVMTIFGTRPEAIKMAPVVKALEAQSDQFESIVCVTGQHREMLDQVLSLFNITPDYDLKVMSPNQTLSALTANVLAKLDPILEKENPDWVLVQGDTTTAMTGSLAAFYRQAQVGHIEAGLRTNDKHHPFPEEINRRITSVVADLHFAPTEWAASNLLAEGHSANQIVVTGNTVIDSIQSVSKMAFQPERVFPGHVINTQKHIVLVTAHRRENIFGGIEAISRAIKQLASTRDDVHFVYPVHLNPSIQKPVNEILEGTTNVTLLPPLDYQPLVWLLERSHVVLTDSGGLQEEAPGLGKPVLVLRNTTERPEGVNAGVVKLIGTITEDIVSNLVDLLDNEEVYARMSRTVNPYGDGNAASKIVSLLQ